MPYELEPRVPEQVHQVLLPPGEEIVDDDHVVPSLDELVHEVATDETGSAGHHDPQPSPADPDGDPADLGAVDDVVAASGQPIGSRDEGPGLGGPEAGECGLDDEEGGPDEDADEDEKEPLLSQEVVD